MDVLYVILGVVGWLLCGVPGYFLLRLDWKNSGLKWNVGHRRFMILFSALFGPFVIIVGLCMLLLHGIASVLHDDTPASW